MIVTLRLQIGVGGIIKEETLEVAVPEKATIADLWGALLQQHPTPFDRPLLRLEVEAGGQGAAAYEEMLHVRGNAVSLLHATPAPADEELSFEVAAAPVPPLVDGFDFPVGKPDGRHYYVAAGLVEYPYYHRFGFWHTGEDWNGTGGGDSDLGDTVYAAAHGRVVTARPYTPSWGNIVMLEHHLAGERRVWTQYAHLRDLFVREGALVRRGQPIGTIGKGHRNQWPAHLHFEVRHAELPPNQWGYSSPDSRQEVLRLYAHPSHFIRANRPGSQLAGTVVDNEEPGFVRTASRYWFEGDVGYHNHCFWTWAVDEQLGEDCVGVWRPTLPERGLYELFAFIPRRFATTHRARYEITHRRGTDHVVVNQSDYYDEWVSLGSYPFSVEMPASVRLSDLTGEPFTRDEEDRYQIAYDSMMWVRVG